MAINPIVWGNPIPQLKFAQWRIGKRRAPAKYITIHYNGPPVRAAGNAAGERAQLAFDSAYHMRPDVLKADGIQYHAAVLCTGERVLLRPLDDILWHCGNKRGNDYSIAIHIPIGDGQTPAPKQLESLRYLVDILRTEYNVHVMNVKPHWEWKSTKCPGLPLASFIGAYRSALMHGTPFALFKTKDNANVRVRADVKSPVSYVLPIDTIFGVRRVVENGVPHNGNPSYVELSDGSGYIHLSIVRAV